VTSLHHTEACFTSLFTVPVSNACLRQFPQPAGFTVQLTQEPPGN